MIKLHLTSDDLPEMRFAYSPMMELVISFGLLLKPHPPAVHYRWIEEAKTALHGMEFSHMEALYSPHYIADFITPTPVDPRPTLERELEQVLATPHDLVRRNVMEVIEYGGETAMRRFFLAHPEEALGCLVEEMREYWHRVLAHYWSRMSAVLENDLLFRARHLAVNGAESVIGDLDSRLQHVDCTLLIYKESCKHNGEMSSRGDGLQFVPVIFGASHLYHQVAREWRTMVMYGARGSGLWHSVIPEPGEALEILLGAGKARVLSALVQPASNTELAQKLSLTAGAVSQQMKNLHQAGMVESFRSGKNVYFRLSERGEKLMSLF